jgi:ureidoglycolate hydrolase
MGLQPGGRLAEPLNPGLFLAFAKEAGMIEKKARTLSREVFAPYGQIVIRPTDEPAVCNEMFAYWPALATTQIAGEIEISWLKLMRRPLEFGELERHLATPELIVPMDGTVLLPVAPPEHLDNSDCVPSPEKAEVFRVEQGQAVLLHTGTWHWAPFPLGSQASCLIIFKKDTGAKDLIIQEFANEERIKVTT